MHRFSGRNRNVGSIGACLAAPILAFLLSWLGALPASAQSAPNIAAASDLQFALTELAGTFKTATGREVKLVFGSSGQFFRQIQEGAPFEVFLSADERFVRDLAGRGLTEGDGALYGRGRIVIFTPNGSPLEPAGDLSDLKLALEEGRVSRFAIANPEHAPYGARAEEALRHAAIWDAIQDKLVLGENVSQAAQFATSGGAEGGIIALSLALSPNLSGSGRFELIPEDWHEPLNQRMVLLKGAGETARLFYDFIQSPPGRDILKRYGFRLPGESM